MTTKVAAPEAPALDLAACAQRLRTARRIVLLLGGATPANTVTTMDAGVIYSAISGSTCLAGDVYATDGRIRKLGLQLLEDDRKFFLPYDGVPEVRTDALAKYPAIKDVLAKVSRLLTNETMQELNGQIDIEGRDPADVAATWLKKVGLVR